MGQLHDSARHTAALALWLIFILLPQPAATEEFRHLRVDGRVVRWAASSNGEPLTLTYAIADRTAPGGTFGTCGNVGSPSTMLRTSGLTVPDLDKAISDALMQWQRNVNVNFVRASSSAKAQILIGVASPANGIAFTDLNLLPPDQSPDGTRTIVRSVICLNPEKLWKVEFDSRTDRFDLETVLAHELGHVLGLDHPGAQGHVMSFRYSESNRGLTEGDREGAVRLYGNRYSSTD